MSDKKMTIITSRVSTETMKENQNKLTKELPIEFTQVNDIGELFSLLSDSNYHTDYVGIDLDDAHEIQETNVFELLNTLATILRLNHRNTKILAIVGSDTPVSLIKEILSFPIISGFALRSGGNIEYEDIKQSVQNILDGNFELPKKIHEIIHPKRKTISDGDTITLTPRQQQIFRMVTDRGASNKVIAKMLNISESTVKLHMSCILRKYKVKNRTQLAVFSRQQEDTNKVQSMPKS